MSNWRTYQLLTVLMVGLFLFFQAGTYVHEAQSDYDESHQECVFCTIISEDADIEPVLLTTTTSLPVIDESYCEEPRAQIHDLVYFIPFGRAPPPRGPPFSQI